MINPLPAPPIDPARGTVAVHAGRPAPVRDVSFAEDLAHLMADGGPTDSIGEPLQPSPEPQPPGSGAGTSHRHRAAHIDLAQKGVLHARQEGRLTVSGLNEAVQLPVSAIPDERKKALVAMTASGINSTSFTPTITAVSIQPNDEKEQTDIKSAFDPALIGTDQTGAALPQLLPAAAFAMQVLQHPASPLKTGEATPFGSPSRAGLSDLSKGTALSPATAKNTAPVAEAPLDTNLPEPIPEGALSPKSVEQEEHTPERPPAGLNGIVAFNPPARLSGTAIATATAPRADDTGQTPEGPPVLLEPLRAGPIMEQTKKTELRVSATTPSQPRALRIPFIKHGVQAKDDVASASEPAPSTDHSPPAHGPSSDRLRSAEGKSRAAEGVTSNKDESAAVKTDQPSSIAVDGQSLPDGPPVAGGQVPTNLPAHGPAAAGGNPAPSTSGPTLPTSLGPVPYGMLPIEIGLGALQGRRSLDVKLSPDELGTVEIRLEISKDSKVSAKITADRPETLALMMGDTTTLRNALDQTGLTTGADSLQFSLKQDSGFAQGNGHHADQRPNGQPPSQNRNGANPQPFQDAVPIAVMRRATGLLDVNI